MDRQPVVLYVEDDPQSRKLMLMILKGRLKLTNVTIFEDSTDFLDRVNALPVRPDMIFLDIHMKPYDGFELLDMLRRSEWAMAIPIVALTASVMSEEVERLRTAGFNGCLAKPLDLASFPDAFRRILNGERVWRITDGEKG